MNIQRKNWQIPFFTIWTGQAVSLLGSAVGRFALIWWLTGLTGSATVLTTATLASAIPLILIGPVAGAFIDRWNRRFVMITVDFLIAMVSLTLAYLFWRDLMRIWHVYVVIFVRSLGSTFHGPAMAASTTLMVPEKHFSRVAGMNQTLNGVLMMVGPSLGALALAAVPLHMVMVLDWVTAVPAIISLFLIAIPQPERVISKQKTSIWPDVKVGMAFLWTWKGLFLFFLMAAVINFVYNPIVSLLPLYVTQHFSGQAVHLGWLQSAQGVGIVLGGFLLSAWGGFRKRVHTTLLGIILQGIATMVFGLLPPGLFWTAMAVWGFAFFCNVFYNGPFHAMLQTIVPSEIQGRVFTARNSMVWIAWPLSLLIAGPLADRFGVQLWIIAGGLTATVLGITAWFIPLIMKLENQNSNSNVTLE